MTKAEEEEYRKALVGRNVPLLTLDNKWHQLFTQAQSNSRIQALEEKLNVLVKRQGKLNTESKDIRRLKRKLMNDIIGMVDELGHGDPGTDKKMDDNRRLILECNEKMKQYQKELEGLPEKIEQVNQQLMLETMEVCYRKIQENTKEIDEITEWMDSVRIEMKKKAVRKVEYEENNFRLYSYMHDIFGPDVIEIFDMKYNPAERENDRIKQVRKRRQGNNT